jgi:competence protein ComEC
MPSSWKYLIALLALIATVIWLAVYTYPEPKLHLIACDVGQGDAILAVYGKTQILIDGGPDSKVLDCLSRHLPFWDREIEIVVLTHPQKDHLGGLIEVFRQYDVQVFVATPLDSSSEGYQVLKNVVGGSGVDVVSPTTGAVIRLGLLHLDILHPSRQYILSNAEESRQNKDGGVLGVFTTSRDPNDFSIVARLRFKNFDALLTGDIGPEISNLVADQIAMSDRRTIEYIKIPHHGSKNGLTSNLLSITSPEIAVISVGKNPWGHPHQEVLKLLSDARYLPAGRQVKILRTDLDGDVEIVTDGERWWIEK